MVISEPTGILLGAIALGAIHGIEPGHGWPVAASYALDQSSKWLYGLAASLIIGVGHLVSSIAMVAVFFYAKSYFELTQVDEPLALANGIEIGGPVSLVAGVLLIALGIREYRTGHTHDHGDSNDHHSHDEHSGEHHSHRDHDDSGLMGRLSAAVPFLGGGHSHGTPADAADRGLLGIAWFAFVLGFAHEEEFEIIAMCAGSARCLELMGACALTVIAGIVTLTLLLIGGYQSYEERVERYTQYLPLFSATVLVVMGLGFVLGVF